MRYFNSVYFIFTTLSTVGYGDRYPVTAEGRIAAGALMVAGIALLGVVTASIASWFVENLRRAGAQLEDDLEEVGDDVERTEVAVMLAASARTLTEEFANVTSR